MTDRKKRKKICRKATAAEKMRAYRVFCSTGGDLAEAAAVVERAKQTVSNWAKKEGWQKDLDKVKERVKAAILDESADAKLAEVVMKSRIAYITTNTHFQAKMNQVLHSFSEEEISSMPFKKRLAFLMAGIENNRVMAEPMGFASENGNTSRIDHHVTIENIDSDTKHAILVDAIEAAERASLGTIIDVEALPLLTGNGATKNGG